MSAVEPREVPTFSQCVIGYRAWRADTNGQLWPLHSAREPWQPGVNVARCNCKTANSLRFQWSLIDGRRILEPAPAHAAPDAACRCGLYSLRSPPQHAGPGATHQIVGAVASWGHIQVHATGIRAEYSCIVTLAYPNPTPPDVLAALQGVAERYRVELVPLTDLEQAASKYGSPLPASTHEISTDPPEGEPAVPADIDAGRDAPLRCPQPSNPPHSASQRPAGHPPKAKKIGLYAFLAILGAASLAIGLLVLLHPVVMPWAPALAHTSELPSVTGTGLLVVPVVLIGWVIWQACWNLELDIEAWRQWRRHHIAKLLGRPNATPDDHGRNRSRDAGTRRIDA